MSKTADKDFDVSRDFINTTWYPQKSVVRYNMSYNYTEMNKDEQSNADETYLLPNLNALSAWNQISK